jgi:hypothetical protein
MLVPVTYALLVRLGREEFIVYRNRDLDEMRGYSLSYVALLRLLRITCTTVLCR